MCKEVGKVTCAYISTYLRRMGTNEIITDGLLRGEGNK